MYLNRFRDLQCFFSNVRLVPGKKFLSEKEYCHILLVVQWIWFIIFFPNWNFWFVFLLKELSKVFPSIPLVAEEDSDFVRSNNLVDSVVSAVTDKASSSDKPLTNTDVLEAIDRGGKSAIVYGTRPATYWVSLSKLSITKVKFQSS